MDKYSQPFPSTQLMTIEEAKHLSTLEGCEIRREERQRARVWSWQTVEGAMAQTVSEEQVERLAAQAEKVRLA
jgi:hypothetical protein